MFHSLQDVENVSRESAALQDPMMDSPDNVTFFKPPSCTPTKKVNVHPDL